MDLYSISDNWIDSAKAKLNFHYFRRSHGIHVDFGGMDALRRYSAEYATRYNYNSTGAGNALKFTSTWASHDFENTTWVQITRDYLDNPDNVDVNVIMWAWSSYFYLASIEQYISDMETLIAEYGPRGTKILSGERSVPVSFIFQTACSQSSIYKNETVYNKNQ